MSEHRYDIRISESCVDPNPLMVERQDPDNFTRFQARERCALEIATYVFKPKILIISSVWPILLEISHFSFLCQLKVLGHLAKNWFGKKIPVAIVSN